MIWQTHRWVIVAGVVIPICFWFLDSVAYYYQVKLRGVMNGIRDRIHQRHAEGYPLKEIGMVFGGISYVGVSSAIARVRQRLENVLYSLVLFRRFKRS